MIRTLAIFGILTAAASIASADVLTLLDGRSFAGTVTIEDDSAVIEAPCGTLRFDGGRILRIEYSQAAEWQLTARLQQTPQDDPEALCAAADWAAENGLPRQAGEIFRDVLRLDPDHVRARRTLGHLRIEQTWRPFGKAMKLARAKLDAGLCDVLLEDILPKLAQAAADEARLTLVRELEGLAQLRAEDFAAARKTFEALAETSRSLASLRFAAIAEILTENLDGMYVLSQPLTAAAAALAGGEAFYPVGPASLGDPVVLQEALRDRAQANLDAGRQFMAAALLAAQPADAEAIYAQAAEAFDRADALVADISRSDRVAMARQMIAALRTAIQRDSIDFDEETDRLGQEDMPPEAYQSHLRRMIHCLNGVGGKVRSSLKIARPYRRELALEVEWARVDLERIRLLRKTLTAELDDES